jgi:hypothetical protein
MGLTFTYTLAGDPSTRLNQINAAAAARGIYFRGNLNSGRFSGMGLLGTYSISGSTITVMVDTKPLFVSWDYIDAQLRRFIEG